MKTFLQVLFGVVVGAGIVATCLHFSPWRDPAPGWRLFRQEAALVKICTSGDRIFYWRGGYWLTPDLNVSKDICQ